MRMKLQGGLEQKAQLAQTGRARFGRGEVFHAVEELREGGGARPENNFVGIGQAEGDGITVSQRVRFGFFTVDEEAALLAAIFQAEDFAVKNQSSALARNAAIGKLEMVAGFRTTADEERGTINAQHGTGAVWRDDFQSSLRKFGAHDDGFRHAVTGGTW